MLQLLNSLWWLLFYLSIPVAVWALNNRSWPWLLASAAMYLPFTWYLQLTPRFEGALLVMLFFLLAAMALHFGRRRTAWVLWLPVPVFTLWVVFLSATPG